MSTEHYGGRDYCNGKVRYASKRDAATVLNARTTGRKDWRGRRPVKGLRSYHCDECNGWHLTHKNPHRGR